MVAVAQLVRALVCGTKGRRFESDQPPQVLMIFLSVAARCVRRSYAAMCVGHAVFR